MATKIALHGCDAEVDVAPDIVARADHERGAPGFQFAEFRLRGRGSMRSVVSGAYFGICSAPAGLQLRYREDYHDVREDIYVSRGPGEATASCWDGGFDGQFLMFAPEAIESFFHLPLSQVGFAPDVSPARDRQPMVHILAAMSADIRLGNANGRVFTESVAAAALRVSAILPNRHSRPTKGVSLNQAKALRDYIAANYAESISLDDLAGIVGMSVGHMLRSFKVTFGITPHKYILRERVARASDLIRDRRLSLADVARQTGFADQSQLSRTFRRLRNIAPTDLR